MASECPQRLHASAFIASASSPSHHPLMGFCSWLKITFQEGQAFDVLAQFFRQIIDVFGSRFG
ncbi:uncharacterized protein Dyak_GE28544 [Drosophila yakuba]|uniref:Uncharacterized protein n=1 Tax=Drosophila yakuba TaxID=7245 RepID=A0A0R1E2S3_DROYA|nr:uncharacterized protein Dyak_GE28544 [Drosophila yakuba]